MIRPNFQRTACHVKYFIHINIKYLAIWFFKFENNNTFYRVKWNPVCDPNVNGSILLFMPSSIAFYLTCILFFNISALALMRYLQHSFLFLLLCEFTGSTSSKISPWGFNNKMSFPFLKVNVTYRLTCLTP